jgi:hypothetical protein
MIAPLAVVVQFTCTLLACSLAAVWYVRPALIDKPLRTALPPLMLLHLIRPVSLWLVVPDVIVRPGLASSFAEGTAYGDLLATALAVIAVLLVRGERPGAVIAAWIFNVVGLLDILRNCVMGLTTRAPEHMGAGVCVVGYGVPVLVVSHWLMFTILIQHRRRERVTAAVRAG